MKQQQLCYKTVRSDGSSVWAAPPVGRCYTIGETYCFPEEFPAYMCSYHAPDLPLLTRYFSRAESTGGNRLLICMGNLKVRLLAVRDTSKAHAVLDEEVGVERMVATCTRLQVIGEVFVPGHYRTEETPKLAKQWHYTKPS